MEVAALLVLLAGALAVTLLIFRNRIGLVPRRINLQVVEFDIAGFGQLTCVKLFQAVTSVALPPGPPIIHTPVHPLMLMNVGWMMVCDAFVSRFGAYPSYDAVQSVVATIGVQNAEFLNVFRDVYGNAIKQGSRLDQEFALAYLARGPALAQRVLQDQSPLYEFARTQYDKWNLEVVSKQAHTRLSRFY